MQEWREWVVKARQGDLAAFDRLVDRFRDMAVGYAFSRLHDFQLAEDVAQEAFVRAYRDIATLREAAAFPAWFRRIVFKYCDRLSRRKKLPTVSLDTAPELRARNGDPFETLGRRRMRQDVLASINNLPGHERAAVSLFYIDGYSMAEVGQFLDVPAATVKSRLHSARRRLKEKMMGMVRNTLKSHAPGKELNERVRRVLTDVPTVSFELHQARKKDKLRRCPESHPFPSCVRACLEHMSDAMGFMKITVHGREWRLDTTYVYLMGTTGAAFGLNWKPGWHMDNPDLGHISTDPLSPYRRGLASIGRDYEIIDKDERRDDEARFRERIMTSIRDHGRPVIARGVVGPPVESLITGFDDGGDVLIGWSYFQRAKEFAADLQFESNGCFRRRGWFGDTHRLIVLGDRRERPPLREVYRDSLQHALTVARTATTHGDRHNGIAAYRAWADAIIDDGEFVGRKTPELRYRYHVHQDAVGTIAEGRWYAHNFMNKVLADVNAPEILAEAARCFDQEHTLMWKLWSLVGGPGYSDKKARLFADGRIRRDTAAIILEAQEQDRQAVGYIEQALSRW
jgi:RNA polymerase sigma factor (sigma-70 family)